MYIPLWTPEWAKQLVEFSIQSGMEYFSVKILVEDEEELKPGRAYLLGMVLRNCSSHGSFDLASMVPICEQTVYTSAEIVLLGCVLEM